MGTHGLNTLSTYYGQLKVKHEPAIREIGLTLHILRENALSMFGIGIISAFIILAIFSPWIAPYDPYELNIASRVQPPSAGHLFGTDGVGRDILSRVIFGSRIGLLVGLVVVGVGLTLGGTVGMLAGYVGGTVGQGLMRITDIFLAFPSLALVIGVAVVMGPSLWNALLAMTIVYWPGYARLLYGQTLSIKENDYVTAGRLMGEGRLRIIGRHVFPNVISPVVVKATLDMGDAILLAAALSFLGLGAQPPTADWGAMISMGRDYLMDAWWMSTFPGLVIFLLVLGFNLLGDALRDALDPTLRRRVVMKPETSWGDQRRS